MFGKARLSHPRRKVLGRSSAQLWVADLTYVRTFAGFCYVALVIDVYSRLIVGWSLGTTLRTEAPLEALEMALWRRGRALEGLVHHSDSEYVPTGSLAWSDPRSNRRERMCGAVCPRVA